jgi:soluble lytic murein transglycosylase-like protein
MVFSHSRYITTPPTILYDMPLDANLQLHIIRVAESYGIDPATIFAMCYQESTYNPSRIGDHGAALGLM